MNIINNQINFSLKTNYFFQLFNSFEKKVGAIAIIAIAALASILYLNRSKANKFQKVKENSIPALATIEKKSYGNTAMTKLLSEFAYGNSSMTKKELNDLVTSLVKQVKLNLKTAVQGDKVMQDFELESLTIGGEHSQKVEAPPIVSDYGSKNCVNLSPSTAVSRLNQNMSARLALTKPNDLDNAYLKKGGNGFPQNTPLILLLKADAIESAEIVLPIYEKKDLLFTTPRGNSILHLAIITGCYSFALSIIQHAKDLNCLKDLLLIKNSKGNTAEDLFYLLLEKKNAFMDEGDFIKKALGGEEFHKAKINKNFEIKLHFQLHLFEEIKNVTSLSDQEISTSNFITLFRVAH